MPRLPNPTGLLLLAAALLPASTAAQIAAPKSAAGLAGAPPPGTSLALDPPQGSRGMVVTLSGARAAEATAVRFGEWDGTILSRSAEGLEVVVPQAPAQALPVKVTFPGGAVSLPKPFQVYQAPTPATTEVVVPPCGPGAKPLPAGVLTGAAPATVRRGATLTLTGRGLRDYDQVRFPVLVPLPPAGAKAERGDQSYKASIRPGLLNEPATVVVPPGAASGRIALFKGQVGPLGECFTSEVLVTVEP